MVRIIFNERFKERIKKVLSHEQQLQTRRVVSRLKRGEPLGYIVKAPDFFEIRLQGKRVYFLKHESTILLVDVSGKKDQQNRIDAAVKRLPELRKLISRGRDQP